MAKLLGNKIVRWAALAIVICVLVWAGIQIYMYKFPTFVSVPEKIFSNAIQPTAFTLSVLTLAPDGYVYGAEGKRLMRISKQGSITTEMAKFADRINAIHFLSNGYWLVATDNDHWNPEQPCRIYLSTDSGQTFQLIKELQKPSAIWWSVTSDRQNNIYVGEYGPKEPGVSERVWKSSDFGANWTIVFRTLHQQRGHIHRVMVDPYTDYLIVSFGDGDEPGRRGVIMSKDQGETWQAIHDQKPTGMAFTKAAIYFGEDNSDGRITAYDKSSGTVVTLFNASTQGNFGGSIYDLAIGQKNQVFAPLLKYPKRQYPASLWVGKIGAGKNQLWRKLLVFASKPGESSGSTTIAGPDIDNFFYITGYRIQNRDYFVAQ